MGILDLAKKAKHAAEMAIAVGRSMRDKRHQAAPEAPPLPKAEARDYTADELRGFDGSDPTKPILLSVKGTIYDVTRGRSFYGKSGPYGLFAGRECARAFALDSLEPEDVTGNLDDLPEAKLRRLEEWIETFEMKYGAIGKLVP